MARRKPRSSKDPGTNYETKTNEKRTNPSNKRNDPQWYTRNQQLALDAGRFSFTWPVGAPVDFNYQFAGSIATHSIMGVDGDAVKFPGVFALSFVPAYGYASTAEDPINVAMFKLYGDVRKANSGAWNYDPPDLMLYFMAMDNIYILYQHMVRAYGLLRVFAQRNRNYPRMLFNAMRLDYDDLLNHMSDLRYYINTCALRINTMCVPATMPLFIRHMWMSSGIYADSPSVKSQIYVFTPAWIGKYNEKTSSNGGYLEGDATLTTNLCKFSDLVNLMDDMIGRVVQSQDCNIMSGDVLKAYGPGALFTLSQISEDYIVEPVFNPEILRQIQNATIVQGVGLDSYATTSVLLYQDPNVGILKSALSIFDNCTHIAGKRILTGSSESPSPEEVLTSTRLMVTASEYNLTGTSVSSTKVDFIKPSYGTEIITNARLFDFDNPSGVRVFYGRPYGTYGYQDIGTDFRMGYFNYHPLIGVEGQTYTGNVLTIARWAYDFDVDDYAILDDHDVNKLHLTALLSLFDIPQMGKA